MMLQLAAMGQWWRTVHEKGNVASPLREQPLEPDGQVQILTPPILSDITLGKFLDLSPQFPYV